MKKMIIILISCFSIISIHVNAQSVGIGTTSPDASAVLDVKSTNKGLLIPRLSSNARVAISSPAAGLMVFDTDTNSFWYYNGTVWINMNAGAAASKNRSIYVTGNSVSFKPSASITYVRWGTSLASNAEPAGIIIPQPVDWDKTQAFSVTLYYAFPTVPSNTIVRWRLRAGTNNLNLPEGTANSGWDTYDSYDVTDMPSTLIYAAPSRSNIAKSVTWTAKYSNTFNTWYLGTGVSTNNEFSNDPMWHFSFQRGYGVSNGESYSGALIITGVSINYIAK